MTTTFREKLRLFFYTVLYTLHDLIVKRQLLSPEDQEKERMETCRQCPEFNGVRCKVCGCFMQLKTKLIAAECPLDKWRNNE